MKTTRKTRRRAATATLTLHGVGAMTTVARRALASWLRRHAKHVERHGIVYAARVTARYHR